jgi:hypothetical protein
MGAYHFIDNASNFFCSSTPLPLDLALDLVEAPSRQHFKPTIHVVGQNATIYCDRFCRYQTLTTPKVDVLDRDGVFVQ